MGEEKDNNEEDYKERGNKKDSLLPVSRGQKGMRHEQEKWSLVLQNLERTIWNEKKRKRCNWFNIISRREKGITREGKGRAVCDSIEQEKRRHGRMTARDGAMQEGI